MDPQNHTPAARSRLSPGTEDSTQISEFADQLAGSASGIPGHHPGFSRDDKSAAPTVRHPGTRSPPALRLKGKKRSDIHIVIHRSPRRCAQRYPQPDSGILSTRYLQWAGGLSEDIVGNTTAGVGTAQIVLRLAIQTPKVNPFVASIVKTCRSARR
jgi:hypothetical protein